MQAQEVDDATRAAARKLGTAGVESYQAGKFEVASEKLEKAYRMLQAPSLGLWSARALVKLGRLLAAQERYVKVTRLASSSGDSSVQKQALVDAASELAALTPRLPSLVVQLEGARPDEVQLTLDQTPIDSAFVGEARPTDPGVHHVSGVRGGERAEAEITLREGEQSSAVLRFSGPVPPGDSKPGAVPASSESPVLAGQTDHHGSAQRTLGWVSVAAGGAGVLFGGVTGGLALAKKSEIDGNARCTDNQCAPSQHGLTDSYNSLRTLSSVGFIAGGALAATGLVLMLTAPRSTEAVRASLWVSPNALNVRGSF